MMGDDHKPDAKLDAAPNLLGIWMMAIRPKTLVLSLSPVFLAVLLIWHQGEAHVDWLVLATILLATIAIQISTNLWNDSADAESGLDSSSKRLGPARPTSLGLLSALAVWRGALFFLGIAGLCGLYLALIGGWLILAIGLAALLCAVGYSYGPYPLSYSPFGELFVLLFFGVFAVLGSAWLLGDALSAPIALAGAWIGLPAAAVLLINNHRDRVGDKAGGRRTLAILLGPIWTVRLIRALLLLACIGLFPLTGWALSSIVGALVCLIYVYFMILPCLKQDRPAQQLNVCLARTSLFQLVLLVTLAIALASQ